MPKLSTKYNLATINHKLAKEWHPSKNENLLPEHVSPNSHKYVWWLCGKGHEWQAIVKSRNIGRGCPYCAGKKASIEHCLFTFNPALAKEWHPKKNEGLTAKDVSPNSAKKVWWKCVNGHEWQATVNNRSTNKSGCPCCIGRKVCKDNSLATINTKLALEWHPDKNKNITPDDVTSGSRTKVWWICKKGHEWQANVINRNFGSDCPYCAGKKVSLDNSLAFVNPELAKEWHPVNNKSLTPNDVTSGSSIKVWWICKKRHEWEACIGDRNRGSGCPKCNSSTSVNELRIYSELKLLFPDVKHRYKIDGIECDIYLNGFNLAVEYDGVYWHNDKRVSDSLKNKFLKEKGISLVRVRENGLRKTSRQDIICSEGELRFSSFKKLIKNIIAIGKFPKEIINKLNDYADTNKFQNSEEFMKSLEMLPSALPWNNLLFVYPNVAKKWNYSKNANLIPEDLAPNSHLKVWWVCDKGHEWYASVTTMIRSKKGCPFCDNKRVDMDNCLANTNSMLTQEWHPVLNKDLTPYKVTSGSNRKVWWICKKRHEWQATINGRNQGYGCPYCSGRKVSPENSLAVLNPELAREWAFEKNKKLTPRIVSARSSRKVWWKCLKNHEWKAPVSDRNNGTLCPYCRGKKAHSKHNFKLALPYVAKQWHPLKNGSLKPDNVTPRSHKKVWWKCEKGHEYQASVDKRYMGRGCPFCAGKRTQ